MLSGAGLIKGTKTGETENSQVHVHTTTSTIVGTDGEIDLTDALNTGETICDTAPIFVMLTETDGSLTGEIISDLKVEDTKLTGATTYAGKTVMVDYYIIRGGSTVSELQIDAENFAGYYYVEAETLFRRQDTGVDMPANITLPNVKIQSNFTFSMAATGDPGTFDFVMDAFPG